MSNTQSHEDAPLAIGVDENYVINVVPPPIIKEDSRITNEHQELFIKAFQYRKTLKVFTIIDGIFAFLNLLSTHQVALIFVLLMNYFGYYSADKYHRGLLFCYISYNTIFLIGIAFYFIGCMLDDFQSSVLPMLLFFNMIFVSWILKICYSFYDTIMLIEQNRLLHILRMSRESYITKSNWNSNYLY